MAALLYISRLLPDLVMTAARRNQLPNDPRMPSPGDNVKQATVGPTPRSAPLTDRVDASMLAGSDAPRPWRIMPWATTTSIRCRQSTRHCGD